MKPTFEAVDGGLEIIDQIERHRYRLTTHESVSPEPVSDDCLQYPVDSAVEIEVESVTLPTNDLVYVRDETGAMVHEVRPGEQQLLPEGAYTLDLSTPFKIYLHFKSSMHIYADSQQTHITLDDATRVIVGTRSSHTRPAGTITTTEEPADLMEAVTAFGSALKTTTPERSYPTLRGHPPALELGETLSIPNGFDRPETGIQIEVPPSLENVYVVAPLAYYLGAEVISGEASRVTTDAGLSYSLTSDGGFEETVERLLKQIFFLDCIVRTEGMTPVPLHERQAIEPSLPFDLEQVYEQPLPKQLEKYLSTPFSTIEPVIPEWRLEVHLKPTSESITFLPYIANDLAIVQIQQTNRASPEAPVQREAIQEFTRGVSTSRGAEKPDIHAQVHDIPTIEQHWKTDDSTTLISTTPLSAFTHSIGREPREDPIEIKVVCNDSEMKDELETVNGIYGNRDELPFNVAEYYSLTRDELRDVLAKESDFVHYIGHIDREGFQCSDGKLSGTTLEKVGAKAFLLNACQSRNQGLHLVEAGSSGGIVTLGDVINSGAIRMGSMIARVLNRGYPLYAALDVARRKTLVGQQYRMVGNGLISIAQSETGPPNVCIIEKKGSRADIILDTYETSELRKGTIFVPYVESNDSYFLTSGKAGPFSLTESELSQFLDLEDVPILYEGEIQWSKDFSIDGL
ncbi:hypothetical protein [Natronosalvus caseinilyticus]|uniref:hypothetical protein n=1 Tax=Natronosalvus caseinilyticus TaxID=2953747 RepID=UPI0028AFD8A4|nr:hypothetical protein [Natronosalvus caseinilyticus]